MRQKITNTIERLCSELFDTHLKVELTRPEEQFGDYSTNVALQLAKPLQKNPREVAETLSVKLRETLADVVTEVSVAGPGFINLKLSDSALWTETSMIQPNIYAEQKIVIETNNPNPFKDLHIGHAYNSIVADTLANLLEAGQGEIHRVSYHGDVGLHVGKSLWAILKFIGDDILKLETISAIDRPKFLSEKYAEGATAYEGDDVAKQQIIELANKSFKLEDGLIKQAYDICKDWSFSYFDAVFTSLGSQPIERRYLESQTDIAGRAVVESSVGSVFEHSDGAIVFPGEKYDLHTRVFISSRNTTLYEARDLGLMQLKLKDYSPQSSYIVTAVEQKQYFQVVLKAAELAMPESKGVTHNISTGTVLLSTGKMSSRTGNVVNIGWLFNEIEKALVERGATPDSLPDSMIAALRYTMLKNRLGSDVVFDVGDAISLEGNSGPYLQYAHARAQSILRKVEVDDTTELLAETLEPGERSLVRKISEYSEVVDKAVAELMPHHICTYLYELAQTFNRFYENNRVIDDERQILRLALVKKYAQTLHDGLQILGIHAPDKM